MSFIDTILLLLLVCIVLLQFARRLTLPYPAVLAAAGVVVSLIPQTPAIMIEPATALTLFIAPALISAAYDFPLGAARRFWAPMATFAVLGVLLSTAAVAWLSWAMAGLPLAAGIAFGAIVAPPDAAAATAVLRAVPIPRSSEAVLTGESLFNDATALLLFGGALGVLAHDGLRLWDGTALFLAVPGGLLLGIGCALLYMRLNRFVTGTLGGVLLQFVAGMLVWVLATRLRVSPVLTVVAYAMTIARLSAEDSRPEMRVHSFAVWNTVVFLLNVLAFLLMGMQVRTILARTPSQSLHAALLFASAAVLVVIGVRLVVVVGFNRLIAMLRRRQGQKPPATLQQGILVGWCGMRGLVTLATAFALPQGFPHRDGVVLAAFAVVLATLVIQGATLGPLIRLLGLNQGISWEREVAAARAEIADAVLRRLEHEDGEQADRVRHEYQIARDLHRGTLDPDPVDGLRRLGREAIRVARRRLEHMRAEHEISADAYDMLRSELDWREITLLPDAERRIEEG